ncbi:MAG: hypothetical protein ABJA37_14545 [Ferruginibacter sp.]
MKKLTTIVALALFISVSAFAGTGKTSGPENETKVTERVKSAFKKSFSEAVNVNWNSKEDFYFADFKLKEKYMTAAYNQDGELLGMSRKIEFAQLPLATQQALEDRFPGYSISKVGTEVMYEGQTNYYLAAENSKKMLKLKCSADGVITIEKTIRKKKLVGSAY